MVAYAIEIRFTLCDSFLIVENGQSATNELRVEVDEWTP